MCLSPVVIENKKYNVMKPFNQEITRYMKVPCGHCVQCLKRLIAEWSVRLTLEAKASSSCYFVTLTYNDDNLPMDGVDKKEIQKFHKLMRKYGEFTIVNPMKYYIISEYGPHGHRPHYHGLYFNVPKHLFSFWEKRGFVDIREPLPERVAYVASYHVLKNFYVPENQNPNFKLSSNFLGLEAFNFYEYENAQINDWRYLINDDGVIVPMPRYYRKKYDVSFPPVFEKRKRPLSRKEITDLNDAISKVTKIFVERKMKSKQI